MITLGKLVSPIVKNPIAVALVLLVVVMFSAGLKSCVTDIGSNLGLNTKENVVKKLAVEKANNTVLVETVKNNEIALDAAEKTSKNVEVAVTNVETKIKTVEKQVATVKEQTKEKIIVIRESAVPEEIKDELIAEIQIRGLWTLYCQNNFDTNCEVNTNAHNSGA